MLSVRVVRSPFEETIVAFELLEETTGDGDMGVEDNVESAGEGASALFLRELTSL